MKEKRKRPNYNAILIALCIGLMISTILTAISSSDKTVYHTISYTDFIKEVESGSIKSVEIGDSQITAITDDNIGYITNKVDDENLTDRLLEKDIDMSKADDTDIGNVIAPLMSIVLYGLFIFYILRMNPMIRNSSKNFQSEKTDIKFSDVAG